jgi:Transposase DDE domain group 1
MPLYEFLEAEGIGYTIRLPANSVLQRRIGYLLERPVGRPPHEVRRYYASFHYQAQSDQPGAVGRACGCLLQPARNSGAVHQGRQGRDQMDPAVMPDLRRLRLQLHALAYNLGNFMRTLAMPKAAEPWSLTSLRNKLIKIGAKVVRHGRYVTFQMAEVAVPRQMFQEILSLIARLRAPPAPV